MKDFVIFIAFIMLGIFIAGLIVGDNDTLQSNLEGFYEAQIENQRTYP